MVNLENLSHEHLEIMLLALQEFSDNRERSVSIQLQKNNNDIAKHYRKQEEMATKLAVVIRNVLLQMEHFDDNNNSEEHF